MARKDMKHYPVVRTGRLFRQSPDPIGPNFQISVEQLLSKTNRRLYRQSRYYEAKLDLDPNATGELNVFVLNDSWMTERALKMGYDMYLENSKAARDRLKDNSIARWEDFRVLSGAGITIVNPLQYDATGTPDELTNGEFSTTEVEDAAGVTKVFHWGGSYSSRYGLLEEYDKAGNANGSPNVSTGAMPYDTLMADDSLAMANDLQNRGNAPPYDQNGVNAAEPWVKVATLSASGTAQKLSTGFFKAPCGFVLVRASSGVANEQALQWTVKAGDY